MGPVWTFFYAVKVFGIAADIPDWLDIRVQSERLRSEGVTDVIPRVQLEMDTAFYCFDAEGQLRYWDWDPERPRGQLCEESFGELLHRELKELEERTHDMRRRQARDGAPPN